MEIVEALSGKAAAVGGLGMRSVVTHALGTTARIGAVSGSLTEGATNVVISTGQAVGAVNAKAGDTTDAARGIMWDSANTSSGIRVIGSGAIAVINGVLRKYGIVSNDATARVVKSLMDKGVDVTDYVEQGRLVEQATAVLEEQLPKGDY